MNLDSLLSIFTCVCSFLGAFYGVICAYWMHCSEKNSFYVVCHLVALYFRKLEDGDIVNVDVTVYYKGVHGKNQFSC